MVTRNWGTPNLSPVFPFLFLLDEDAKIQPSTPPSHTVSGQTDGWILGLSELFCLSETLQPMGWILPSLPFKCQPGHPTSFKTLPQWKNVFQIVNNSHKNRLFVTQPVCKLEAADAYNAVNIIQRKELIILINPLFQP